MAIMPNTDDHLMLSKQTITCMRPMLKLEMPHMAINTQESATMKPFVVELLEQVFLNQHGWYK